MEEIEDALRSIKIGKASGEDQIEPEMLKSMGKRCRLSQKADGNY